MNSLTNYKKRSSGLELCSANKKIKTIQDDFFNSLPNEILFLIFKILDAKSLLTCSSVCKKWNKFMKLFFPDSSWEKIARTEIDPIILEEIVSKVSPASGLISWSQLYRCWYVSSRNPNKWCVKDIQQVKGISHVLMISICNEKLIIMTVDNELQLYCAKTKELLSYFQCEFRVNSFHIIKLDNIPHIVIVGPDVTYLGIISIQENKFANFSQLAYNAALEPILNFVANDNGQIAFFTNLSFIVYASLSYSSSTSYHFSVQRELFTLNYSKLYFWDSNLVKMDSLALNIYSIEDGNFNQLETFILPKYFITVNGMIKTHQDVMLAYDYYTLFKFTKSDGGYVLNNWVNYNKYSFKMISFNLFSNMFVLLKPKLKSLMFKCGDIDSVLDYFKNDITKNDLFRDFFSTNFDIWFAHNELHVIYPECNKVYIATFKG